MSQYAFLNAVYVDKDDNSIAYEIVFSTQTFTRDSVYHTDFEGLKKIAAKEDLIRDFYIDGDFLRSNEVPRVLINDVVKRSMNKELVYVDSDKLGDTLISLLVYGVENGFYVLDDRVIEDDEWTGNGLVGFKKIRFSQSSMSIYTRMIFGDTIRNFYLVQMQSNTLKSFPFYFAVPEGIKVPEKFGTFIKKMTINNVAREVYRSKELSVVETVSILAPALINKAATTRAHLSNLSEAIKKFVYPEQQNFTWVDQPHNDGNKGVIFKNSTPKLKRSEIDQVVSDTIKVKQQTNSFEEFKEKIQEIYHPSSEKNYVSIQVARVMFSAKTGTELIATMKNFLDAISECLFYVDKYLYGIRVYLNYTDNTFLIRSSVLYGSDDTNSFTIVEGGSHNGGI